MLSQMNLLKVYENLEKNSCLEPKIFWKIDEGRLETIFKGLELTQGEKLKYKLKIRKCME